MHSKYFLFLIAIIFTNALNAQNTYHVTHTEGTKTVNGVTITVTHKGTVLKLDDLSYCYGETGPYYFGTDYKAKYSDYTLTFSPPITGLTLNFTGLTASSVHMEEIQVFINDKHYAIPQKGSKIDCEEMAILTSKGNIRPCHDCGISGWKGTKIEGPIDRLTVADTVISGEPAGVLFALYIGNPIEEPVEQYTAMIKAYSKDIVAGKGFVVYSKLLIGGKIELTDRSENIIPLNYITLSNDRIFVDPSNLKPGAYNLSITLGDEMEKTKGDYRIGTN